MISVPALSGVVLAGPHWVHIPLLLTWWIGYFFFQAAALWLKSRFKTRYLPPVRAYGILTALAGVATVILAPWLAWWLIPIAPLAGVAGWCSWNRRERSLLNDTVTVLAACLMTAVVFSATTAPADPRWPWVWLVTATLLAYFWGTIVHVKALIRERDNPAYPRWSGIYHGLLAAAVATSTGLGVFSTTALGGWFLTAVWVGIAFRSLYMPWRQRTVRLYRPREIGVTEIVFSLLLAAALLF